jgi:hypothetical protein
MRKLLMIGAVLGLSVGFTALTASADGVVDYTVTGTYAAIMGFPSTPLSTPGDTFTFTFSVDPALLTSQVNGTSNPISVSDINYTDSSGHSLTNQAGTINFFTVEQLGLFDLEFLSGTGDFFLSLQGPAGFNVGPPLTLNTGGPFTVTPGDTTGTAMNQGSILGDFDPSLCNSDLTICPMDAIIEGKVTATPTGVPEPSSLLLLGSGFLALGGFARKRVTTLFN